MVTDYTYSKTTKTQIAILIIIPILSIICVCKMLYNKRPIYVDSTRTSINISEKENNGEDENE